MRQYLQEHLVQAGMETPANISLVLLQDTLNRPKSFILSHGEYPLDPQSINQLQLKLAALLRGVPLPYVLGYWEFFGRKYSVTPDVLIPRPETELLVERAIQHIHSLAHPRIVDVGTGSGAIAISLAAECPDAVVYGVDLSLAALQVAQNNAKNLCPGRLTLIQADLITPFECQFDLICANLPYIPRKNLEALPVARYEPRLALDGGASGLAAINALLQQAQSRLSPTGILLLEIDASLGAQALAAARSAFPNAHHQLLQDLTGRDRLVEIRLVPKSR